MWQDFKAFLIKQNMLALALAVVIGAATNDLVQGIVNDFIMPIVTAAVPNGAWAAAYFDIGPVRFTYGHFLSVVLKFFIIGFVCWRLTRMFVRTKADAKAATRDCPYCRQNVDARATKCAFCTSELAPASA